MSRKWAAKYRPYEADGPIAEAHPEARSLLRAIQANPTENTPRFMYADWVEEFAPEAQFRAIGIREALEENKRFKAVQLFPERVWHAGLERGFVKMLSGRLWELAHADMKEVYDTQPIEFIDVVNAPLWDFSCHESSDTYPLGYLGFSANNRIFARAFADPYDLIGVLKMLTKDPTARYVHKAETGLWEVGFTTSLQANWAIGWALLNYHRERLELPLLPILKRSEVYPNE